MFSLLGTLRSVAETFPKANFSMFQKLRLYFVHPSESTSGSCQAKNAFPMICKDNVAVLPKFEKKEEFLSTSMSTTSQTFCKTWSIGDEAKSADLRDIVSPSIRKISKHSESADLKTDAWQSSRRSSQRRHRTIGLSASHLNTDGQ
ncbi:hypothetical protein VTP01DRAFT_9723 [Rhizomucor pusillus]|uniref:uncharacterized protein n=1 Tax=Rhizomucor pusillus TaxID=4840 RepID=UPI003744803D